MSTTWDPTTNDEATAAWNGPLFDSFLEFREIVTTGLGAHGEAALELRPPQPGDRVLDIGCGFGDTAQRLGELVGPDGSVLGVDVAERFVETAQRETEEMGVANVRFDTCDVETTAFDEQFDYAFSRFGTMFFANPVAALRRVREALAPGGTLCMVVWRRREDNDWMYRAEVLTKAIIERPEESDVPTCGPGPFSMAGADTTSDILLSAGFEDVHLHRRDIPIMVGRDMDQAIEMALALGPAAEVVRLAGADADSVRPQIEAALREGYEDMVRDDGVWGGASTWVVVARNPG
jgi:SAM-dependent methyltransferase